MAGNLVYGADVDRVFAMSVHNSRPFRLQNVAIIGTSRLRCFPVFSLALVGTALAEDRRA